MVVFPPWPTRTFRCSISSCATTRTSTPARRATRCSPTASHRRGRTDVLGRRRRDVVGAARHHAGAGDPRGPDPRPLGDRARTSRSRSSASWPTDSYKDFPDYRYFTKQDDTRILEERMRRVTDTSIPEDEAFRAVEKFLVPMWKRGHEERRAPLLARVLLRARPARCRDDLHEGNPEECWLLAAAEARLPIVVPGYEDSTFGNIFASHVKTGECSAAHREVGHRVHGGASTTSTAQLLEARGAAEGAASASSRSAAASPATSRSASCRRSSTTCRSR